MFSFCESIHATSNSPWHIRKLTGAGKFVTGGVDTPSLCGLVERGWDLEVDIDVSRYEDLCCPKCVELYKQQKGADDVGA